MTLPLHLGRSSTPLTNPHAQDTGRVYRPAQRRLSAHPRRLPCLWALLHVCTPGAARFPSPNDDAPHLNARGRHCRFHAPQDTVALVLQHPSIPLLCLRGREFKTTRRIIAPHNNVAQDACGAVAISTPHEAHAHALLPAPCTRFALYVSACMYPTAPMLSVRRHSELARLGIQHTKPGRAHSSPPRGNGRRRTFSLHRRGSRTPAMVPPQPAQPPEQLVRLAAEYEELAGTENQHNDPMHAGAHARQPS